MGIQLNTFEFNWARPCRCPRVPPPAFVVSVSASLRIRLRPPPLHLRAASASAFQPPYPVASASAFARLCLQSSNLAGEEKQCWCLRWKMNSVTGPPAATVTVGEYRKQGFVGAPV